MGESQAVTALPRLELLHEAQEPPRAVWDRGWDEGKETALWQFPPAASVPREIIKTSRMILLASRGAEAAFGKANTVTPRF